MVKIGAMWLKEKDGREYLSGRVDVGPDVILADGLNLVAFRPKTERTNGPAWEVFVSKPKPQAEASRPASASRDDDEIPF